mmetsp:Transcript_63172/g.75942  ORF Transcript_63172/g.75942 Transcript_63172/m.75942 type:complete len:116 (+) Transcript_63172:2-349(+)
MSSLLDSLGLTYDVAKLSKIIESGERNERADEKRSKKKFSLGTTDLKYDFELDKYRQLLICGNRGEGFLSRRDCSDEGKMEAHPGKRCWDGVVKILRNRFRGVCSAPVFRMFYKR